MTRGRGTNDKRNSFTAAHAAAYADHYEDDEHPKPLFSQGAPSALESSDYIDVGDSDNEGYKHSFRRDHNFVRRDSLPLQHSQPQPQSYFGALIKLCILCALIGWMSGFTPYVPSHQATLIISSPLDLIAAMIHGLSNILAQEKNPQGTFNSDRGDDEPTQPRPYFVYEHPYVSSSYYTSTKNIETLLDMQEHQIMRNIRREAEEAAGMDSSHLSQHETKTRLAIVRPFCEFDAEALPTTFTCWNALPPCKAASDDIGLDNFEDLYEVGPNGELMSNTTGLSGDRHKFDLVGSDTMKNAKADVFLFYSQSFSENDVAINAVDAIIDQFFEPGGWSQCFDNIYAIEANIPQELDLYIPSAQEELYNWVNGPNRQFEAAFRIIQSGEWGEYDGFYLMEGDSVPIKAHWLDVVLSEIEVNRPFAILGAQYDGDKWDNFYEKIPISLLHHTNGNAIYNTSHPLLERLVGQLEVEAPCPYNSIPYDYRMSQMWVEGTLGIVPELAPKIMLNEEGENIILSGNTEMFNKWADIWEKEDPFKYTPVIHNYAATNLIPRHLGPEYIIHGAKLYSPWNPTKTDVTLVVSEWFFDRSSQLITNLDDKDHPFSEVVVMLPPVARSHDDYDQMSDVPVRTHYRGAPDFMDLCEADVKTEWFMITNSYHHVARHVDLMFTPGTFKPVIPFTPATYAFCFKYPYCKETVKLAQRINPGHDKVVMDMDMLYNTKDRNAFCKEWMEENGEKGEDIYNKKIIGPSGPTGTAYYAWLVREKKDGVYKMTDRSLYGARPPFVKIFAKEEKLDGMSEDELAKRVGITLLDNSTDCNCGAFEIEVDCTESGIGCMWRPLFESCHPPELIDGSEPICLTTEAPTMTPTTTLPFGDTESPTSDAISSSEEDAVPRSDSWYTNMFKVREHELETESNSTEDSAIMEEEDDDAANLEPDDGPSQQRKLETGSLDPLYETDRSVEQRIGASDEPRRKLHAESLYSGYGNDGRPLKETHLPTKTCDSWDPSIVPRNPTVSNTWGGASPDPLSRSLSAMAISRPRKLHGSYLRYQLLMSQTSLSNSPEQQLAFSSTFDSSSPMKDSWLTSSVPINVPKYAMYQEGFRSKHIALDTPEIHKTFVMYSEGDDYQPIRITFATDHRLNYRKRHKSSSKYQKRSEPVTMATISRIEALTGDILPAVSEIWAGALSVLPSVDNIFPFQDKKCGEAEILQHHWKQGFPNTDTLIYVTIDGSQCYSVEDTQDIVSYASVCSFDQNLRPISANIDVCLSHIDVASGEVSAEESLRMTTAITIEVGKVLGLSPSLFHHFRNSETGQPYGSARKTVTCVDGTEQTLLVPNVLQSSLDLSVDDALINGPYFQVTTPTVRQVIRNHFDCQRLLGARLNQGVSSSCFGDSFDPRYHFDDDLASTGGSADMAFSLSPLTLALLEDSGWYRANFQTSTVPLFGRGGGCGFVEGNCIGESKTVLPDYSQGFFCNDAIQENQDLVLDHQPSGCDYTHNHKADCFSLGESESDGLCPMRIANIKSCSDQTNSPSLAGEVYSLNSRCFVTDASSSVCLESYCNSVDSKIDIVVSGFSVHQCDYEGQEIDLGQGYIVKCPRLALVCPHLVCPANCSGKGVCDYCLDIPQCVCDDPFDLTSGCYGLAENHRSDDEEVTDGPMRKKLSELIDVSDKNEKELEEEDAVLSNLREENMDFRFKILMLRSKLINRSEGNGIELQHEDGMLHGEELLQQSKNSMLHQKLTKMRKLRLLQDGDEEAAVEYQNILGQEMKRELQTEDEEVSYRSEAAEEYKNILELRAKLQATKRELLDEDREISYLREAAEGIKNILEVRAKLGAMERELLDEDREKISYGGEAAEEYKHILELRAKLQATKRELLDEDREISHRREAAEEYKHILELRAKLGAMERELLDKDEIERLKSEISVLEAKLHQILRIGPWFLHLWEAL